jgi:hypothetical protein
MVGVEEKELEMGGQEEEREAEKREAGHGNHPVTSKHSNTPT